jgi:hypothetical protein
MRRRTWASKEDSVRDLRRVGFQQRLDRNPRVGEDGGPAHCDDGPDRFRISQSLIMSASRSEIGFWPLIDSMIFVV